MSSPIRLDRLQANVQEEDQVKALATTSKPNVMDAVTAGVVMLSHRIFGQPATESAPAETDKQRRSCSKEESLVPVAAPTPPPGESEIDDELTASLCSFCDSIESLARRQMVKVEHAKDVQKLVDTLRRIDEQHAHIRSREEVFQSTYRAKTDEEREAFQNIEKEIRDAQLQLVEMQEEAERYRRLTGLTDRARKGLRENGSPPILVPKVGEVRWADAATPLGAMLTASDPAVNRRAATTFAMLAKLDVSVKVELCKMVRATLHLPRSVRPFGGLPSRDLCVPCSPLACTGSHISCRASSM